jgi:hypothetical protein
LGDFYSSQIYRFSPIIAVADGAVLIPTEEDEDLKRKRQKLAVSRLFI